MAVHRNQTCPVIFADDHSRINFKKVLTEKAVDQISFQAFDQEILVLLGTSGCGKTTTLKMINRLIESDSGNIFIDGKNIRDQKAEELRMGIGLSCSIRGYFPIIRFSRILQ